MAEVYEDSHDYLWDYLLISKKSCPLLTDNFRGFVTSGAIQAFEKYSLFPVIHAPFMASKWMGHSAI